MNLPHDLFKWFLENYILNYATLENLLHDNLKLFLMYYERRTGNVIKDSQYENIKNRFVNQLDEDYIIWLQELRLVNLQFNKIVIEWFIRNWKFKNWVFIFKRFSSYFSTDDAKKYLSYPTKNVTYNFCKSYFTMIIRRKKLSLNFLINGKYGDYFSWSGDIHSIYKNIDNKIYLDFERSVVYISPIIKNNVCLFISDYCFNRFNTSNINYQALDLKTGKKVYPYKNNEYVNIQDVNFFYDLLNDKIIFKQDPPDNFIDENNREIRSVEDSLMHNDHLYSFLPHLFDLIPTKYCCVGETSVCWM